MTRVETLRAILADGARPDDLRWAEVGATEVRRGQVVTAIAWERNGDVLIFEVFHKTGFFESYCQPSGGVMRLMHTARPIRDGLSLAQKAHLARMTEGA